MKNKLLYLCFAALFCGAVGCDAVKDAACGADGNASGAPCGTLTCTHSLEIEVLLAGDDPFPTGMYSFDVIAPDGSEYWLDCILLRPEGPLECSLGDTELLSAAAHRDGFEMLLHIVGAPPHLWLTVSYNDTPIGTRRIAPDYAQERPNGAHCEPVCYTGDSAIAVAFW
ncbi:MAG: hypothetical protein GX146_03240 [Myxococcales bacterium]|jgi:hypothetical protein|nr:hypothetical protein [Myxococcales bacterium]